MTPMMKQLKKLAEQMESIEDLTEAVDDLRGDFKETIRQLKRLNDNLEDDEGNPLLPQINDNLEEMRDEGEALIEMFAE